VDSTEGQGQVIERNAQVEMVRVAFDRYRAVALPVEDSAKLIRAAMESS
jgi:hypothetical protein